VRALSARYVESRGRLPDRSPIDSAGKRAAFAAFYAPLHSLTAREVVRALWQGAGRLETIVDLGCGTGAASAAWALEQETPPAIRGVDLNTWVLLEAAWNWRQLGLKGITRRANLVETAEGLAERPSERAFARTGVLLAWSANELDHARQRRLLTALARLAAHGATVLVIEPIARSVTPWWAEWVAALGANRRVRADDWKFDTALPPALAELNESAGFSARKLSARSLMVQPADSV
jgi:SAM-dependent methyltransferase